DVWFEAPAPGATLRDTVRIVVGYFDESGVDSVQLIKDGAIISPPLRGGEIRGEVVYLWNTSSDSDGVHLWQARAWDKAGNVGVSMSLLVRVKNNPDPPPADHTPPVVNWLSPQAGDTVQGLVELRFQALDNVRLASVVVYVNGAVLERQILNASFFDGNVIWSTNSFADGNYIVEVRAWDSSGNVGIGVGVTLRVWNNRPRVIWVPDDYRTIQGAINASRDGDTVRVRAGIYSEPLHLWDRKIWIESEYGPVKTIIDVQGFRQHAIYIDGCQDTSLTIRGFCIRNSGSKGIFLNGTTSARIINNIIINSQRANLHLYNNFSIIRNNVFANNLSQCNIEMRDTYGPFENNIIANSVGEAFWNINVDVNPASPNYNLIWLYDRLTNDPPIRLGEDNIIDQDPLISDDFFHLHPNSPCINHGNPLILDLDGSRSDIGVFGGPYAYR
ncbi:MAG: hypothetical protein FJY65_06885, partial [Calditrichaeota bacterium]|nr:hypothetical protein [Calditrichota bacterium]